MDRRNLRAVLRHAAALAGPCPADDAALLDRFRRDRDEAAFAELVRRHGRLVWAVCRPLLPTDADAEDAFQATFLVLVRSAGSVRDGNRLGPWLHGVAVRVCSRARRALARRKKHEHAVGPKSNGAAVPDSAWDAALAAVHEEIARLPETLRVPFVLCCLEGHGVTEAARRLGWKLGTLSGRLTRAKQTLMARLDARGLGIGSAAAVVVAGGATADVPAALADRTVGLAHVGVAVPGTVLHLSQGVVGMSLYRTKLLAASFLLVGGLTAVGSGWLATADAQPPNRAADQADKRARDTQRELDTLRQAQADLLRRHEAAEHERMAAKIQQLYAQLRQAEASEAYAKKSAAKWEYKYLPQAAAHGFKQAEFESLVNGTEAEGWHFVGIVNMQWASRQGGTPPEKGGQTLPTLVFRRPAGATGQAPMAMLELALKDRQDADIASEILRLVQGDAATRETRQHADQVAALRAQIEVLQARLAELQKGKGQRVESYVAAKDLGNFEPTELLGIITTIAKKRWGTDGKNPLEITADAKGVTFSGSPEVVNWAVDLTRKLTAK